MIFLVDGTTGALARLAEHLAPAGTVPLQGKGSNKARSRGPRGFEQWLGGRATLPEDRRSAA